MVDTFEDSSIKLGSVNLSLRCLIKYNTTTSGRMLLLTTQCVDLAKSNDLDLHP